MARLVRAAETRAAAVERGFTSPLLIACFQRGAEDAVFAGGSAPGEYGRSPEMRDAHRAGFLWMRDGV